MFSRISTLLRITAVRLSIIYTLIFGIVAVGIVAYMTGATVKVLRQQYEASIDREVQGLANIYQSRGLRGLISSLERRARAPGANLYIVTSPSGEIIAGNVPRLESGVMRRTGWTGRPFRYYRYGDNEDEDHRAIARVMEVPNGLRILVGRDLGEHEGFRKVVGRSFALALGTMLLFGLLTWLFVGRRALKRIDQVSQSSARIMGGDKAERLPISGSGDEFDRLSGNLNRMLDRIHKLDDGLKQMSDNIAHDLKTPITRLRNKADAALGMREDDEAREQAILDIIGDCDQIVRTFDALLMISRVESGASVANFSKVDLAEVLSEVHELFEAVAEEDNIELIYSGGVETPATVYGNRELIAQALSNLIDNAMKYGRPAVGDHRIELGLEHSGKDILAVVADNGPGVPGDDVERVTERFVRLDKSRNKNGNGLGLSLVKAIAGMHGGALHLKDNEPGMRAVLAFPAQSGESNA